VDIPARRVQEEPAMMVVDDTPHFRFRDALTALTEAAEHLRDHLAPGCAEHEARTKLVALCGDISALMTRHVARSDDLPRTRPPGQS
jgi:hypothetical protein